MKDGVPGKIEVSMTHAQSPAAPQASSFGLSAEPGQLNWCNTVNIEPQPAWWGAHTAAAPHRQWRRRRRGASGMQKRRGCRDPRSRVP